MFQQCIPVLSLTIVRYVKQILIVGGGPSWIWLILHNFRGNCFSKQNLYKIFSVLDYIYISTNILLKKKFFEYKAYDLFIQSVTFAVHIINLYVWQVYGWLQWYFSWKLSRINSSILWSLFGTKQEIILDYFKVRCYWNYIWANHDKNSIGINFDKWFCIIRPSSR